MAVSAFPAVVDALVTLSAPLVPSGVTVADAMPGGDDPSDFLAVGVQSLDTESEAGQSRQTWAEIGARARDEEGVVQCLAVARSDDETVKGARDKAFAIAEAVAGLCRSNPTLGVASLLWTSYGVETNATPLYETGQPVAYLVEFQVAYRARI